MPHVGRIERQGNAADHIAHHDDAGAAELMLHQRLAERIEAGDHLALLGQAHMLNDGHGCVSGQALQELLLNVMGQLHAHVDHQGETGLVGRVGQGHPVGPAVARFGVSGDEHHAVGVLAVRERHTQRRHASQAGGDAVDHLHLDAVFVQVVHFLATATKEEGVAALEPHHLFALEGRLHHEFVDEGLGRGLATAAFAHLHHTHAVGDESQNGVAHQVVHQHHGGGLQGLQGLEGQQVRVTRAGANQPHAGAVCRTGSGCEGMGHGHHPSEVRAKLAMRSTCTRKGSGRGNSPASTAWV